MSSIGRRPRQTARRKSPRSEETKLIDGLNPGSGITGCGDPTLWHDGSQWHMVFAGLHVASSDVLLFEATLPAGTELGATNWTVNTTPIATSSAGQFDESGMETPSYVKVGNREFIYYVGINGSRVLGTDSFRISRLEKINGTWTRHGSPLLTGIESWELYTGVSFVSECTIVHDGSTYHLFYTAGSNFYIGYANSTDGTTFSNKKIFYSLPLVVWSPTIYRVNNHYEMILSPLANAQGTGSVSETNGLYRMKCATPSSNYSDWSPLQQIHKSQDGTWWHSAWIYGTAAASKVTSNNLVVLFTGRDPINTSTNPHIGQFPLAPLPD